MSVRPCAALAATALALLTSPAHATTLGWVGAVANPINNYVAEGPDRRISLCASFIDDATGTKRYFNAITGTWSTSSTAPCVDTTRIDLD